MKHFIFFLAACALGCSGQEDGNTATLSWVYTSNDPFNDSPTFVVYQGLQGETKVAGPTTTATTLTIESGLLSGKTYCWVVTAKVGANESLPSNEACKSFPAPVPNPPEAL